MKPMETVPAEKQEARRGHPHGGRHGPDATREVKSHQGRTLLLMPGKGTPGMRLLYKKGENPLNGRQDS